MRNEAVSSPRTGKALLAALTVALGALMLAAFASPAQAETFKVTNTNDSGPGSLRKAISSANANGGADTIRVTATGTVVLRSALPKLTTNMKIVGPGASRFAVKRSGASGTPAFRDFTVGRGATVSISGLTVTKGNATYCTMGQVCGGIKNSGTLTVTGSIIRGNSAGTGGGIENSGSLTVKRSYLTDNSGMQGGGIGNANGGTATVIGSTISRNGASGGGGIANLGGTLTVKDSTISGNRGEDSSGGIYSTSASGPAKTTITNSTISGNSAYYVAGGVYNVGGRTLIKYSTITNNTSLEGGGVASYGRSGTRTEVFSSIISANTGDAVDFVYGSTNTFTSKGYNVIGYGNATGAFNKTGDLRYVGDPGLGPLAANGGPTRTHALQSGSPAINGGSPNCPPPATDQRGVKRPQGGRCDTGSFEFGARR